MIFFFGDYILVLIMSPKYNVNSDKLSFQFSQLDPNYIVFALPTGIPVNA
jgi:hypothetical protein